MAFKGQAKDAVIIGGGPAGLAAALALRQKGIDCLVVDALRPPIDKSCGEGLMPNALASLSRLGVTLAEDDGHSIVGIRLIGPTNKVEARFPHNSGLGVRRLQLHQRMHECALNAGASFAWGSHARLTSDGKVLVNGAEVCFRWLIGADGTASAVRRWAGMEGARQFSQRFGYRRHYQIAPWSDYVEVYWSKTGQLYVTPVATDQVCLVFITLDARLGRDEFLNQFPEVASRLRNAVMMTPQRAGVSVTRQLKRVAHGSVALVGDASGSVDAITGEGLAITFRQASALAASIEGGGLDDYNKAHASIGKTPRAMARLMLSLDRWPMLQKYGISALASDKTLFEELLSVHLGIGSLQSFSRRHGPSLGWNLLAALTQR